MASNQIDRQHFNIIDFLRGIASLMVVFVHYFAFSQNKSIITDIAAYGQYGVIIFFVVSGFIIPYSLSSSHYSILKAPQFLARRMLRLSPPYYIIVFTTVLFVLIVHYIKYNNFDTNLSINIKTVFLHLTYLIPFTKNSWYNNVFWTLAIEFQYYILIALIYPLLKINKILTILFMTIFCFSHYLAQQPFAPPGITLLNYSTPFVVGILLFMFKTKFINSLELIILSSVFLLLCKEQISGTRMLFALFAFIFILFIDFRFAITDFLGKISYSLYLTHTIVNELFHDLFEKWINFSLPFISEIFTLFIILPLAILIAYQFYLWIELPSIKLAKKLTV